MDCKILSAFPLKFYTVIVYKAYLKTRMEPYLVIKFSNKQ